MYQHCCQGVYFSFIKYIFVFVFLQVRSAFLFTPYKQVSKGNAPSCSSLLFFSLLLQLPAEQLLHAIRDAGMCQETEGEKEMRAHGDVKTPSSDRNDQRADPKLAAFVSTAGLCLHCTRRTHPNAKARHRRSAF
uniref:Putative secreted protein n=1 Tax=Ixodes ricinus TaxID=34613 RepID=A0A6B0UT31_IXORI